MTKNNPQFPLYIPSKGRSDTRLTSKALTAMRVPHHVVVEQHEFDAYAAVMPASQLLVLDTDYQRDYDTCDALGASVPKGSGPARNFIWAHAISRGFTHHWIMDDNIRRFLRLVKHMRIQCADGMFFRIMEDFILRYKNVAMAGPHYRFFAASNPNLPPFSTNTRIYSCNLIRNDVPFRWRGRYNEDTILSLDMLKAGWCTIQFYAFLQEKMTTLTMKGGNTDSVYAKGTLPKSRMLADVHPDVARVVWKYGRWHHQVDYTPFKKNKLLRRDDVQISSAPDDYGMRLVRVSE